ncbi:hypothetical protein COL08_00890 [Priestia megaterium]|nr:hypothetical protein CON45_20325 [Priestia megaterium]PEE45195.1 hypothetical protein COM71_22170 [Priestia megaterium]PFK46621.1 hypothetical protein COJ23_22370 [Priestia megaterium]PFW00308.1 hypothetical protein COL08_00890 [Priestia megaterium]PGR93779.1 hypothetical protein COC61_19155 [Priestia megaterium]
MKMGNCKKQYHKRPELDINELFKRIKFNSKQIQKTFEDIEDLLKKSQRLMQQLLKTRTQNNGLSNENVFFNVAEAPAAPPPPTPPATPSPLPPITELQRTLIINIFSTIRDIRSVSRQITDTIEAIIGGLILLRARIIQRQDAENEGQFERAFDLQTSIDDITLGISILDSQLENLRIQLEGLQENLEIYIALLANTVL